MDKTRKKEGRERIRFNIPKGGKGGVDGGVKRRKERKRKRGRWRVGGGEGGGWGKVGREGKEEGGEGGKGVGACEGGVEGGKGTGWRAGVEGARRDGKREEEWVRWGGWRSRLRKVTEGEGAGERPA
jgi:hypothetical protein